VFEYEDDLDMAEDKTVEQSEEEKDEDKTLEQREEEMEEE
jgi:hypothetical protein